MGNVLWFLFFFAKPTEYDQGNPGPYQNKGPPFEDIENEVECVAPSLFNGLNETTAEGEVGNRDRNNLVITDAEGTECNLVGKILKPALHRLDVAPHLFQLTLDVQHLGYFRRMTQE